MRLLDGHLHLSATDFGNHLACRQLTQLDRAAAEGRLAVPTGNTVGAPVVSV